MYPRYPPNSMCIYNQDLWKGVCSTSHVNTWSSSHSMNTWSTGSSRFLSHEHDKCFTNPTHSMCGHYHCCRQLTCRENGTVDSIKGIIAEELITTGTNCPCCFYEKTLVKVPGQLSWLDVCCSNCKAIFEVKCSSTSEKNRVLEIRAGSWTGWLNKDKEAANMHLGKKSNKSYTWKGIIVILTTGCEYDISNVFFIPRAKIGKM